MSGVRSRGGEAPAFDKIGALTRYAAQVSQDWAQIADIEAQLAQWQAKLALAHWTYERNSRLAAEGGATGQALEQSQADLKVADATLASLKAQIDSGDNGRFQPPAKESRISVRPQSSQQPDRV